MLLFQMEGVEDVIAANDFALWRLMAKNESEDASIVERQIAEWKGTDALQAGREHSEGLPGNRPGTAFHIRNPSQVLDDQAQRVVCADISHLGTGGL